MAEVIKVPPELQELLFRAIDELEQAAEQRRPVQVDELFRQHPALRSHSVCARELVYNEYVVRGRLGQRPSQAEYLERYPDLAEPLRRLFLLEEIYSSVADDEEPDLPGSGNEESEQGLNRRTDFNIRIPDSVDLFGKYRLIRELGRGGMGVVYLAENVHLGKKVALKLLSHSCKHDQLVKARFLREMLAIGSLNHPHVVQALDAGEVDGTLFLALEYLEGADLNEVVLQMGSLPIPDACEIVRQAAAGLQHAHEAQLVHRDLKPSNIFLTKSGVVKILDLGLARLTSQQQGTEISTAGQVLGTVDYMAPEQAADVRQADIRSDLYSLGCSFYKLLTGAPPYSESQSVHKKLELHARAPIPDVTRDRSDVPGEIVRMLERLLAKSPANRFASPAELIKAITPFCEGADLQALAADVKELLTRPDAASRTSGVGQSDSGSTDVRTNVEVRPPASTRSRPETPAGSKSRDPDSAAGGAGWNRKTYVLSSLLMLGAIVPVAGLLMPATGIPQGSLIIEALDEPLSMTIEDVSTENAETLFRNVDQRKFLLSTGKDFRLTIVDPQTKVEMFKSTFRVNAQEPVRFDLQELHRTFLPTDVPPDDLPHTGSGTANSDEFPTIWTLLDSLEPMVLSQLNRSAAGNVCVGEIRVPQGVGDLDAREIAKGLRTRLKADGMKCVDVEDVPDATIEGQISVRDGVGWLRLFIYNQDGVKLPECSGMFSLNTRR